MAIPAAILIFGGILFKKHIETAPILNIPAPVSVPNPNGYDFYVAAAQTIQDANPPVSPINDTRNLLLTNPSLAAHDYSLARKKQWLQNNARGFRLFQKGVQTPARQPSDRDLFGRSRVGRNYADFRQLARDKSIQTETLILQNKPFDATQSGLDNIQMGEDISRGGALIAKLVGSAIVAIARDPLCDARQTPEKLTAPQARAAATRLETILANRPTFADALTEDKWVALNSLKSFWKDPKWRSQSYGVRSLSDLWTTRIVTKTDIAARVISNYDIAIANAKLPYGAAPAPFTATPDPISQLFQPSSRMQMNEAREIVPLNLLLLRFALRAYRLEKGAFPPNLNALAPGYLKTIPTDYYSSGKPFFYRLKGQNYELWSVGPDGVNNNGVPVAPRAVAPGMGGIAPKFPALPQVLPNSAGDWVAGKNR